jgi:L-alanine-DL-glutamate epimerase-like enolase superfamily enzyme
MKVTGIKAHILKRSAPIYKWKEEWAARSLDHVLVRLLTDVEGVEGQCLTYLMSPMELKYAMPNLQSVVVGRDPHEVEAISFELTDRLERPTPVASTIDICLWDLIGKLHGEPIYRLLGAARNRIRAYASTFYYDTPQKYVDLALECRKQGFNAYKIHPSGIPEKDIEICRAVRAGVGPDMDLMLDPINAYDRAGALKVGRVLDELKFYWYETPLPDSDIEGLRALSTALDLPVTAVESVAGGLRTYPQYVGAVDSIRAIGDWIGGISAMRKAAAFCEAYQMKFEPHSYGTVSIMAAHLHVMLSTHYCDFVEIAVPKGCLDIGMKETIWPGQDGYVTAPTKPGLGYDIDWEQINALTEEVVEVGPLPESKRIPGRKTAWT